MTPRVPSPHTRAPCPHWQLSESGGAGACSHLAAARTKSCWLRVMPTRLNSRRLRPDGRRRSKRRPYGVPARSRIRKAALKPSPLGDSAATVHDHRGQSPSGADSRGGGNTPAASATGQFCRCRSRPPKEPRRPRSPGGASPVMRDAAGAPRRSTTPRTTAAGERIPQRLPRSAKKAPWGSMPIRMKPPPGTSIGPFTICPPADFTRSAASSMLPALK
jgi:hypothetical protein